MSFQSAESLKLVDPRWSIDKAVKCQAKIRSTDGIEMTVISSTGEKVNLSCECVTRPAHLELIVKQVLLSDPSKKMEVVVPRATTAVVSEQRIVVPVVAGPRKKVVGHILLTVPVTEIVVVAGGANKQMNQEVHVRIHHTGWRESIRRLKINGLVVIDGCENAAAIFDDIIPIARTINASVGSPNVSRWNPDHVFTTRCPIA